LRRADDRRRASDAKLDKDLGRDLLQRVETARTEVMGWTLATADRIAVGATTAGGG
jgi:hypothetical protein